MKSNLKMHTVLILLPTTVLCWDTKSSQLLQATRAGATLPSPRGYSSAFFDEEDSVYIYGGYALHTLINVQMSNVKENFPFYMNRYNGNESYADILLYNIASDTIEKVSSLSSPTSGGLVLKSKDANFIYHFGGTSTRTAIQVFNPAKKITVTLNTVLPSEVLHSDGMTIN
jgi:hypothetical protein